MAALRIARDTIDQAIRKSGALGTAGRRSRDLSDIALQVSHAYRMVPTTDNSIEISGGTQMIAIKSTPIGILVCQTVHDVTDAAKRPFRPD